MSDRISPVNPHTLVLRAINCVRNRHLPTYVGLRCLLASRTGMIHTRDVVRLAHRRLRSRAGWRYFCFPTLKEIKEAGTPHYRDWFIGSPLTLVAEALALSLISRESSFQFSDSVYSYLWPASTANTRTYAYYRFGYLKRNARIAARLNEDTTGVAVVNDVKQFYPTVSWERLAPKVQRRIEGIADASNRRCINNMIDGIRSASGRGLPIGPDVSHLLANVAMEDVDASLRGEFGDRYFRYVDDIIIVCPSTDANRVQRRVEEVIQASGLTVHEGKKDVVSAAAWNSERPESGGREVLPSFESFISDVRTWLFLRPDRAGSLTSAFRDADIAMPMQRMVSQVRYGAFQNLALARLTKAVRFRGFDAVWVRFKDVDEFVRAALGLRERYLRDLEGLREVSEPLDGMRRRWFVQKCRYFINRLLYLCGPDTYGRLRAAVPTSVDFAEQRVLLEALISGNASPLLRFPGPVIAAFCELAVALQSGYLLSAPRQGDRVDAESLSVIALLLGARVREGGTSATPEGAGMLLEICDGGLSPQRTIRPMSYLHEMELLLRGRTKDELTVLGTTRFDERESLRLEGLLLGGESASG